jgi:hypothetical protein
MDDCHFGYITKFIKKTLLPIGKKMAYSIEMIDHPKTKLQYHLNIKSPQSDEHQ